MEQLIAVLERLKLREYMEYLNSPRKVFWRTFLFGIARGLGTAIGFSILGAILIYFLQKSLVDNLPELADLITDIFRSAGK